jgi:hypothetical protein
MAHPHGSVLKACLALVWISTGSWNEFLDSLLMVHSYQYAEGFGFSVTRTMGPVVFLDSLLMVHPWQRAESFGFGVNLNMILERSTTHVQRVRLYSLILC